MIRTMAATACRSPSMAFDTNTVARQRFLVRGVVGLLNGGTDPASVADLVTVALGPLADLREVRPRWPPGALSWHSTGTATALLGGLGDVRLQRLLQGAPILGAQVHGPRLAVESECNLLGVRRTIQVVSHGHGRLLRHERDNHTSSWLCLIPWQLSAGRPRSPRQ